MIFRTQLIHPQLRHPELTPDSDNFPEQFLKLPHLRLRSRES